MMPVLADAGPARDRAGPDRLRPLGQAGRVDDHSYAAPRRVGARARLRRARPARRHARRPGLGRPDRAAAGRRAPRPVRAHRRGQHRPADRRRRHARDLAPVPRRRAERAGARHRPVRAGRLPPSALGRGARRLRRAVPGRVVQGRPARDARARAQPSGRPGQRRQPRGVGARSTASPTPMLVAFSDGDPITGGMRPILRAHDGRRGRARAPGDRGRRALPAGGRRPRAGRRGRRVRVARRPSPRTSAR